MMRKLALFLVFLIIPFFAYAGASSIRSSYGNCLIENKGQWGKDIKFATTLNGLKLLIMTDGIVYDYFEKSEISDRSTIIKGHVIKMKFENSNYFFNYDALEQNDGYVNYFIGNDPDKWVSDVKTYNRVKLNNIYNGVDVIVGLENNQPRYDLIVHPGIDPNIIKINFEGTDIFKIDKSGSLVISTTLGEQTHGRIYAYQDNFGTKTQIPCSFHIQDKRVGFNVGNYDNSKPLIIDPLVLITCWGGSLEEEVTNIANIKAGSFVATGWTKSMDFITTPGAYSNQLVFQEDIFVSRYTIKGSKQILDFSTFLGGGSTDIGKAVTVDTDENVYITGWSSSDDYPVKNAMQPVLFKETDVIVTKLSKDGKQLVYSTYLGGGKSEYGMDIIVQKDNFAYICGYTNSNDFPTTSGSFQKALKGLDDIFVTKLSPTGSSLKFSTLIGGKNNDRAYGMYVDFESVVYLTGETNSDDMPVLPFSNKGTPSQPWDRPYCTSLYGGYDAFIIKLKGEGAAIDNSTYFGGSGDDRGVAISVDEQYYTMYIAGSTFKELGTPKFPITNNAVSKTNAGGWDCFYAQMDKVKPQTGSGLRQNLIFSTFFGSTGNDVLQDMVWDKNSAATYMTGSTTSSKFPVVGENLIKNMGKSDAFITKFNTTGSEILHSTLIGGDQDDCSNTIAVDERGDVIFGGYTKSVTFPVTNNQIQSSCNPDGYNGFIAKQVYAQLTLSSPSGKERYCPGQMISVRWESQGFSNGEKYSVELGRNSDSVWKTIGSDIVGNAMNWKVENGMLRGDDYFVRVTTNSGLTSTNPIPISLLASPAIKSFTSSPENGSVCEGDTIKFHLSADGDGLKLSWFLDDVQFQNQSDTVLTLNTSIFNKSGKVKVTLVGACNPSITSQELNLTVKPATKILSQSGDSKVKIDKNIKLFVVARGENLTFDWFKDGSKIMNEVDSTFTINGVSESHQGIYKCIVSGDCGIVTSQDMKLTIDTSTSVFEGFEETKGNLKINVLDNIEKNNLDFRLTSTDICEPIIKLISNNGITIHSISNGTLVSDSRIFNFDVTSLANGTYWIVADCKGERAVCKVLLMK